MDPRYSDYFNSLKGYRKDFSLEPIQNFFRDEKIPVQGLKCIQILGTNGKGSTAEMISSSLSEAGLKTGLYTSPHLVEARERIRVNGKMISSEDFDRLFQFVKKRNRGFGGEPKLSHFEFLTAIAALFFLEKKCDFVVLEAGLGGRLDATTAFPNRFLFVVPSISIDHSAILGSTIPKIAGEKAAAISENSTLVIGKLPASAKRVFEKEARKKNSRLLELGKDFFLKKSSCPSLACILSNAKSRQLVSAVGRSPKKEAYELKMRLFGRHQAENACCAIAACELLGLSKPAIEKGVGSAFVEGRFQILKFRGKTIIVDGSHNFGACKKLVQLLGKRTPKFALLFAAMKDKEFEKELRILLSRAESAVFTSVGEERSASPKELLECAEKIRLENGIELSISAEESPRKALFSSLSKCPSSSFVLATGSLYLAGSVLAHCRGKGRP